MKIRTQLKAGGWMPNHSEALRVRTTVKAGGWTNNHSEALRVRTTVKAGGWSSNHNESLRREDNREPISMRRTLVTTSRKEDRLALLVVRAGLRAGRRSFRSARK